MRLNFREEEQKAGGDEGTHEEGRGEGEEERQRISDCGRNTQGPAFNSTATCPAFGRPFGSFCFCFVSRIARTDAAGQSSESPEVDSLRLRQRRMSQAELWPGGGRRRI